MKSDRWQRVNQIFEAALEFAAEERRAFVSGACDGDVSLRQEVESLLAAHNEAESFMERPAVAEVVEAVLGSEKLFKGQRVGQYKILGELGQGGQGAVYQALDTKLNRTVALKLLPPELTVNEINRKRFQREAQLASALDHPNICTIHDLTEFDGLHFIVMQFVAGRNIRELVGGHPLELTSALKVAIQVCDALAAAHAQGIIHRDIKAQNVIVTDNGQAKILDFGLAKLTQEDPEVKDQTELTVQGSPYGTPTYAAPEQSRGERVDHRADIFSTGVLLYEMLAGTGAFHGKTAVDVRHAVLHETPKPIAELRGEPIPEKLQATIDRALAKEPRERFQNIAEMRNELIAVLRELPEAETSETTRFVENFKSYVPRRIQTWNRQAKLLMAGAVLLGLILAGFLTYRFIYSDAARTSAQPVISSVAVMPFANIGGDANTEYLSDGVTETLIDSLSKLPNVAVKSRSSVFRYKGREIDPSVAGSELSVQEEQQSSLGLSIQPAARGPGDGAGRDREGHRPLSAPDLDWSRTERSDQTLFGQHRSLSVLPQRPIFLAEIHSRRSSKGRRVFQSGHCHRSYFCAGLCGVGRHLRRVGDQWLDFAARRISKSKGGCEASPAD